MDATRPPQPLLASRSERRASFSPMKAIRSFSISSHLSQSSTASESDPVSKTDHRRTLRKKSLIRKDSKSSAESADRESTSTRPTTPSILGSTSITGDVGAVVRSGPLQPEASLLKSKKEYLVLTSVALIKFKSRGAAELHFPCIATPDRGLRALTPVDSHSSLRDLSRNSGEVYIPLERIVSVFKDEGTRPSFGLEVWWKGSDSPPPFGCLQLDFRLPDERDDWLKQIRQAMRSRIKAAGDERAPPDIESDFKQILEAQNKQTLDGHLDIFPVIPRRPYTRHAGEVKKNWRESSSFYLAFGNYSLLLAQFSHSSTGQKVNPSLVQFGLVTLSRVLMNMNEERFDLVFRMPLDQPQKLELSSRYNLTILQKLFGMDTYLKPAWPFWTRRAVFFMESETQQVPLPNGEDYGGLRTTLKAFLEGYHCPPINWTVRWKNVPYAPQFCLLNPTNQTRYTANQLLAVFRAIRFNDFFKSISFRDVDFHHLANLYDNTSRLESTVWLSRTGKFSLTRGESDLVESSTVLFQELVAILLGSDSIRHIDLSNVLKKAPTISSSLQDRTSPTAPNKFCEIMPPIVLLWKSLQTRCSSIALNGNDLSATDAAELCRALQNRPKFLRTFEISRCNLDEASLVYLWEGLHEQRLSLQELDISYNPGRIEASRIANTLEEANKLRRLNLAYSIRGSLDGPLFKPWSSSGSFDPWHLEDLDLSGWKINFDTVCGIMKYLELDESKGLHRLALNNCGISGEMATGLFCRVGNGRDLHLFLSGNPLEVGSTDWIDLIYGNEAPSRLHLDMVQFQHESNFNRLLTALSHNKTIRFLSLVGTGPPGKVSSETSSLLSEFLRLNNTLEFLDLSGYSGKLEDGHLGWGLSGALGGLEDNLSLRQLRLKNHDIGAAEDLTEFCRILAANRGLAMFDCRHNNFDHHQFDKIVNALNFNHQLISFTLAESDREYAVNKEKRLFLKSQTKNPEKMSKSTENKLNGLMTWVRTHWDSEANKVAQILARNREIPMNRLLELDSEYLDAWDDVDLPTWLTPKAAPHREKGKRRASEVETISSFGDTSPTTTTFFPSLDLQFDAATARHNSDGPLQTYVIEEEGSSSDFESHSNDTSPTGF